MQGIHEISLEIDTVLDETRLEQIVLDYAKRVSGYEFKRVFFDIKKNQIRKIVVYSNIQPTNS
jgi:hypothetical protein